MSDGKKAAATAAEVPAKENIVTNLKKWVTSQLTAIKKTILSTKQVEDIAEKVAKECSVDAEYIARVALNAVNNAKPTERRSYLVNFRWELPHFGGIPVPPGVCFYGFKTLVIPEPEVGQGLSRAEAKAYALDMGAGEKGLIIESLSVVPGDWTTNETLHEASEA